MKRYAGASIGSRTKIFVVIASLLATENTGNSLVRENAGKIRRLVMALERVESSNKNNLRGLVEVGDASTADGSAKEELDSPHFRFHRMSGMPYNFDYPLSHSNMDKFANHTTNAVSMRLFTDRQVTESLWPLQSSYQSLLDEVYVNDNLRPSHPDSSDPKMRERYWAEFREVVAVQLLRESGELSKIIFPPHKVFPPDDTIDTSAQRVFADFPTDYPTLLFKSWGPNVQLDSQIFGQCSHIGNEFVNGPVAIGEMIGWAIRAVSPAAFASKWHEGRCRPEEAAWEIYQNYGNTHLNVPKDIEKAIHGMGLVDATDFTAYKSQAATRDGADGIHGEGGAPIHPSYPAMHSAASSASTWMAVIANLSKEQLEEARLLDFCISYYRTMAGVHYQSDNRAGLALGQQILIRKLPDYLAFRYGCDDDSRKKIRDRVEEKIAMVVEGHDWSVWEPEGWVDPVETAQKKGLI